MKLDYVRSVIGCVLALGLFGLVFAGKITWPEALIGVGLVLVPSAVKLPPSADDVAAIKREP